MRQTIGIVLVLVCLLAACSSKPRTEVVGIEKTGMYHRPGCPLTNMAKTKLMTLAVAKAEHLKPCPLCKPDTI
jgi:methylphosphotriester-DNA--protein-cysteine methyltransferase